MQRKLNKRTTNILASSFTGNAGAACLLITVSTEGLENVKWSKKKAALSRPAMNRVTSLNYVSESRGLSTSTKLSKVSERRANNDLPTNKFSQV